MIPYYSPNLGLLKILKAFWSQNSEQSVIAFFKELTGKEFILLTSSCRAAMYLAYQCVPKRGNVIASPLACKSALEPILYSGNLISFADVDSSTFNIDSNIPELVGRKAFAIQAIHLGGIPNDMEKIAEFAKRHHLFIVEDCAQALGAFYKQKSVGRWGDIACFSLIKTGYGIGGGVLATNDENIYKKAKKKQTDFATLSTKIVLFRLIRSLIETHRSNWFFEALYRLIMKSRNHSTVYQRERKTSDFKTCLRQPAMLFFKIFAEQISHLPIYWAARREKAKEMIDRLDLNHYGPLIKKQELLPSFTKIYAKSKPPSFDLISKLNQNGIEAKHLEHKYFSFYQERFDRDSDFKSCDHLIECKNYFKIHDHLISLPLFEKMTKKHINKIKRKVDASLEKNYLV